MSTTTADIRGIAKSISEDIGLNHQEMVAQGIQFIENLGGQNWTNYNPSDPGIVMLENLCFALLDLGYKSTFSVKDLLTDKQQQIQTHEKLYTPDQILFSNPVTINDYRKLLIDRAEQIKNVWINTTKQPASFKGLYEVQFEMSDALKVQWLQAQEDKANINDLDTVTQSQLNNTLKELKSSFNNLKSQMEALLHQYRNLGEFFFKPYMLKPKAINFQADIYLEKTADVEQSIAWIYYQLNNYLSEFIVFSTYDELKEEGQTVGEIMAGPRTSRGFIKDELLTNKRKQLDPQQMKALLMGNPAIISIDGFKVDQNVANQSSQYSGFDVQDIAKYKQLALFFNYAKIVEALNVAHPNINIYHGDKRVGRLDQTRISTYYEQYTDQKAVLSTQMEQDLGPAFPQGDYREVAKYHSIQNVIPKSFGLSLDQTQEGYSKERLGQIKQLKAFLMLMEQVIADHQQQMASLPALLSFDAGIKVGQPLCQTLTTQGLYDVPGAKWILTAFRTYMRDNQYLDQYPQKNWDRFKKDPFNVYKAFLDNSKAHESKNILHKEELLSHLYARLGGKYNNEGLLELNPNYKNYNLARVENISELLKHYWLYSGNMGRSYFRPEFRIEQSHNHPRQFEKKFRLLFSGLEYKFGLSFQLNAYYKGIIDIVTTGLSQTGDNHFAWVEQDHRISVTYYGKEILNLPAAKEPSILGIDLASHKKRDERNEEAIVKHINTLKQMCRQTRGFVLIDNILLIKQLENECWEIIRKGWKVHLKRSGSDRDASVHNLRQVQAVLEKHPDKFKEDTRLEAKLRYKPIPVKGDDEHTRRHKEVKVCSEDAYFKFTTTVMLPDWVSAVQDAGFQQTFQKAFANEGPVHLNHQFFQLDADEMDEVLTYRKAWMGLVKRQQQAQNLNDGDLDAVGSLLTFLKKLNDRDNS